MNGVQNMQGNALPEIIRMRALKGFRGQVDGQWGVVAPGDIVDVSRELAMTLRYGQKAVMVEPSTEKKRAAGPWIPERKKHPQANPQAAQVAALTDAVVALQAAVQTQSKALEALLAGKK
jgi:hypothetical protein